MDTKNVSVVKTRPGKCRYPWHELEVGDSFDVPLTYIKHESGNDMARVRLVSSAWEIKKNHGTDYQIHTIRHQGVVRCWRLK